MRARPPPRCHNRSVTSRAVPSSFPWRERELPWLPGHLRWLVSWWVGGLVVFNLWKIFFTKKTWDRSEGIKKMIGEDQRDGNKNDEWWAWGRLLGWKTSFFWWRESRKVSHFSWDFARDGYFLAVPKPHFPKHPDAGLLYLCQLRLACQRIKWCRSLTLFS